LKRKNLSKMPSRRISELDQDSIIKGYLACHENAENLMRAAETLFNHGLTPCANSLLIVAVEEEIKAFMIHGVILNPEFSQSLDLESLFRKHEVKMKVAKRTLWWWEHFARYIQKTGIDNLLENPELHISRFLEVGEEAATKGDTDNDERIDNWFNQMKDRRENGFYVDFNNKKWLTPDRVTAEDYQDSKEICKMLVGVGRTILGRSIT
jgi:AbiV family abortive infection protein